MGNCIHKKRSSKNKNKDKNYREKENITEISKEFDIKREQDWPNELIEVTESKPCYRNIDKYEDFEVTEIKSNKNKSGENKSDENKFDENKFDENKFDENKFDENKFYENKSGENKSGENKSDENKSDENKFDENKSGENKSGENKSDENKSDENKSDENKSDENKSDEKYPAIIYIEITKSKIRESRELYFASFNEAKPNQYQISENNKRNISSVVEKKKLIDEIVDDTPLKKLRYTENKKVANDIVKEILDSAFSEIIIRDAENEFIKNLVENVLLNAVKYAQKLAIEELFDGLLIELIDGLLIELLNELITEILQTLVWKPLGFANPKGYCYLNSVVQVLGSCEDFKKDIYEYNLNTTDKTKDSIFVEGLFDLIKAITEYNEENLEKSLNIVQQNITESSFGDDVYKCFMNLLTRVSNVIKTNIERPSDHFTSLPITLSEKAKNTFTRFKNRYPGFVFDNFYGQLTFQTVCKNCNHLCNESFQMIKSLPLPVPNSNSSETLNSCIDLFFKDSDVEVDEPMKCKCESASTMYLKSISKLTHGPKYLFIYLNRGSYTDDGVKNDTHVTCDDLTVHIKTLEDQSIKYKLISVIDHVGDSAYGHYYCKCSFETEDWWLLNDSQVCLLKNEKQIVTKNTIVFLFKISS